MRTAPFALPVALLGFLAAAPGCAAHAAPCPAESPPAVTPAGAAAPAPYRAVHIDTIAPGKFAQFEDGRRAFVEELHRAHAADKRGLFVKVGDDRFFTIRAFTRFAEFDTRIDAINKAMEGVSKEAGDRYDAVSDTALVFPHTSEIWRLDDDLAYAPSGGALTETAAACGRIVIEDARPDPKSEGAYEDAWKEIKVALTEAKYPLTRETFRTSYGAGHVVTLWLAPSKEVLDATPSVEVALAKARGAARAAELLGTLDAAVAHRETYPITVRQDLSSF